MDKEKAEVSKFFKEIKDQIEKQLNLKERIEKDERLVAEMGSDPTRFPAGIKPFKSPQEFESLNLPFRGAINDDLKVEIIIKKGSTTREAMMTIYHYGVKRCKIELSKAWRLKLGTDVAANSKEEVVKEIAAIIEGKSKK